MRVRSVAAIALAGVLAAASSPAFAAPKQSKKMSGACAQSTGRCFSDCDTFNWCTMYTCNNGQSTPVPFWRCFEPSGLCLAPRCS